MKKESEYVGLFIINGASVDKRKSLPAMTENPDSSRFKVGSDVKMTTVSSKAAQNTKLSKKSVVKSSVLC